MLSEALIYKETGCSANESNVWVMKKLSSSPNLDKLFYCLSLHPQLTKPFIRASDILGALAAYYQDVDFRPNKPVIADAFRSGVVCNSATVGTPVVEEKEPVVEKKIVIGSKETPEFLKPKTNAQGIKVREPKVDIANLEIVF